MQDMFLNKFKKLKSKNKVLFNKALKKKDKSAAENDERDQIENSAEMPISAS